MLKTHSGIKKRFKVTGSGKLKISQSGKRHGLRRRSARSLNEHTGYTYAHSGDIRRILRGMPGQKVSRITNYRIDPANRVRMCNIQLCAAQIAEKTSTTPVQTAIKETKATVQKVVETVSEDTKAVKKTSKKESSKTAVDKKTK